MIYHWLTQLYRVLLYLYPASFRDEFGEEMLEVFSISIREASRKSITALADRCLHEFVGLSFSILRIHKSRHFKRQPSSTLPGQDGLLFERNWRELAFALVIFLLPAGLILINQSPQVSISFSLLAAVSFLGMMVILGWLGGKPLWSLPYVSIILVIAGYLYLFQWVVNSVAPSIATNLPGAWDPSSYLLLKVASHGMLWLTLFCLTLLIVAALAVFNRFQPLFNRVQEDWTQLSYILYGESIFALLVLFKSHHLNAGYSIASLLILLTGIWFFLRSSAQSQRILALLACLTLAVGVVTFDLSASITSSGIADLVNEFTAPEGGRLLLSWVLMAAALLLPGVLARSRSHGRLSPSGIQPGSSD
jgi:hypothetical protein